MGCCKLQMWSMTKLVDVAGKDGSESGEFAYFAGEVSKLGGNLDRDIEPYNYYVVTQVQEDPLLEMYDEIEPKATLWMGSKGALTPMHNDAMHNFYVQIYGEKKFTLYPPEAWGHLYLYPKYHLQHRNVQVNIRDVNYKRFPRFKQAPEPIVAIVRPGDVLYLPPGWFHEVEALTPTPISVNIWSPAIEIEFMNLAWDLQPFDYTLIGPKKTMDIETLIIATVQFLRRVSLVALASDGKSDRNNVEFYEAFLARYKSVYSTAGENKATATITPEGVVSDDGLTVNLQSQENKLHQEYLKKVEKKSPPLLKKRKILPSHFDICANRLSEKHILPDDLLRNIQAGADEVGHKLGFNAFREGLKEIYYGYYVEDLIGQIFGLSWLETFTDKCLIERRPRRREADEFNFKSDGSPRGDEL